MMLALYRISVALYAFAVRLASPFKPKAKLFIKGRKDLLMNVKAALGNEQRPRIWMHCASLGEFEQGRTLLESLRKKYPDYALVLTFFSPSGYQVRRKEKTVDYVFYLPIDTPQNAKHFIADVNPALALFVKYDLWYFMLRELYARDTPAILVSAVFRKSQGYFKAWGGVQRAMLQMLRHTFVQDAHSAKLLAQIGITEVSVAGDTRFDRVLSVAASAPKIAKMELQSAHNKFIIAGSTWPADEALLSKVLPKIPADRKLVIVPHEVDKSRIAQIMQTFSGKVKLWSEWKDGEVFKERVLVVDSIGLLLQLYAYGELAWIGGGLSAGGVHNVLEAAVYGLPCAFGPVHEKYLEAKELIHAKAGKTCNNEQQLADFWEMLLQSKTLYDAYAKAAQSYVRAKAGATEKVTAYLEAKNWLNMA